MKKRMLMDNNKIRKIVSDKLKKDGTFIKESKIDKAIKDYLNERSEGIEDSENGSFSPKAKRAFGEMSMALNDIIEDLYIIQTKEPDVEVDLDINGEQAIDTIIEKIEEVLDMLDMLKY